MASVRLTPQDVRDKAFTATRLKVGYNEDEVDEFLDLVEAELTRLYEENEALKAKLASAQAALAASTLKSAAELAAPQAPEPEKVAEPVAPPIEDDLLSRTLMLAQKTAEDTVSQARDEAARLVTEAMERAVALERQSTEQHQASLASYAEKRSKLEAEIERLRAFEREYRTRLKAYLEMQLRELVGSKNVAASTVGQRSVGPRGPEGDESGEG